MSAIALAIRPDAWNLPLFVHVLGAMVLMGALLAGAGAIAVARGELRLQRVGYRALLWIGLPSWIAMRAGAQWIFAEQGWDDAEAVPAWIDIGFIVGEGTGVLLLLALVLGGVGLRRRRAGGGQGLLRAAAWIAVVILVALIVAVWAMGAKPS